MGIYDLKTPNPFREHITQAQWWFWEQLHELEPTSQLSGFYANKPGYHNKRKNLIAQGRDHGVNDSRTDYSIRRPVDRRGPDDKTAGADWGFPEAWSGDYRRPAKYGRRVRAAFDRRDSRLSGWREFLGQTDTDKSVAGEGLDFHTWTTRTPDSSHETHHHFSEDREQVASFENKARMISILAGFDSLAAWLASKEDDDMPLTNADLEKVRDQVVLGTYDALWIAAQGKNLPRNAGLSYAGVGRSIRENMGALTVAPVLAALSGLDTVDETKLAAALAPQVAQAVVALLPEDRDDVTVDELTEALRRVLGSIDGATPAGG